MRDLVTDDLHRVIEALALGLLAFIAASLAFVSCTRVVPEPPPGKILYAPVDSVSRWPLPGAGLFERGGRWVLLPPDGGAPVDLGRGGSCELVCDSSGARP